jgi:hypothetical protein
MLLEQIEKSGLPPPETRTFVGHKLKQGRAVA